MDIDYGAKRKDPICFIVGAGPCEKLDFHRGSADYLIAADGGLRHVAEADRKADLVVGDFDTLGQEPAHDNIVRLPVEKDETDTFVAIEKGIELGYRNFALYGCLGGKPEHTVANLQILAWLADRGLNGWLVGEERILTALKGPGSLIFPSAADAEVQREQARQAAAREGRDPDSIQGILGLVSVFAHTDRAEGVTLRGLKYPLENAVLTNGFPLGISNEFTGEAAEIRVEKGILLVVLPRRKK